MAWRSLFQRREPVAKPTKPVKRVGRSKKVNAPIKDIGLPQLNDNEAATVKKKREQSKSGV